MKYNTIKASGNRQADAAKMIDFGKTICGNVILTFDGFIKAAREAQEDINAFNVAAVYKYGKNQVIYL